MFTPMSAELANFFPEHNALLAAQSLERLKAKLAGAVWVALYPDKVIVGLRARRTKQLTGEWACLARQLYVEGGLHSLLPRLGKNGIPLIVKQSLLQ